MRFKDPAIDWRPAVSARTFQALFPLAFRLSYSSPRLRFATRPIARPRWIRVPTRHGPVRAMVYAPVPEDVERQAALGSRPPVHLIVHGGAFVIRVPQQEDNVARYLASEVGCYVVVPDYDTAPSVRFPVSEEQNYDVYRWVAEHGSPRGWDGARVTVGGPSAGAKFAADIAAMAIDDGYQKPLALSLEYGCADMLKPDSERTSARHDPVVPPQMMRMVRDTYFKDVDLSLPHVSPAHHPRLAEFPPTLVMTGEYDTLRHEMNDFAADLSAKGVQVTAREFAGVDHGFTHTGPVGTAREAITMIGTHLAGAYDRALA